MSVPMIFVISSPRSGSTMLERMLESHSMIQGGPEPHLLTPLAHMGPWAMVDKAPYDPAAASAGQTRLIGLLPEGEVDYWRACRAYGDVLYGRYLARSGKSLCLDKTPAYALILPFLVKVYPDAKYVVLTRHPLATFSSYANSFFDGDYFEAHRYNPLLNRYVPALAEFLRQDEVPGFHVKYEDLVQDPESWMERLYGYLGVPFERETIQYGHRAPSAVHAKGLGDPIGVRRHDRPTTASIQKWVGELAADPSKLALMRGIVDQLSAADLATLGYPKETLWQPLEEFQGTPEPKKEPMTMYRLQRKAIVRLRNAARRQGLLRQALAGTRAACEHLLKE